MKKAQVLRGIVALQAVCMIVLAVVVTAHYVPIFNHKPKPSDGNGQDGSIAAPEQGATESDGRTVAIVGGEPITERQLMAELRHQYGEAVLRTMMLRIAVRLEAETHGLEVMPEETDRELARMMEGYGSESRFYSEMKSQLGLSRDDVRRDAEYRLLLEKLATRTVQVTEAQIDDYIGQHAQEFEAKEQLQLRWIVTERRSEASDVLNRLSEGEPFDLMARTYSIDTFTADNGGDLGVVDADDPFLETSLLEQARAMEVGEVAGPIQTDGGYAVVRLDERRVTSGLEGEQLRAEAGRRLALEQADSLTEVEAELLFRYSSPPTNTVIP